MDMQNKVHVLYISYDGMTDPLGQSQVLPYLAELSKKGVSFDLISFEKKTNFETHANSIESYCKQNCIQWHPLKYTKKPPLLSTIYDLAQMRKTAKRIIKNNPIHIIHCRSYIAGLIGLELKRKKGIHFLFDMRGFWADERIDGNIWSRNSKIFKHVYSFFKKKELDFFKESDHVISLTQAGKDEIIEHIVPNLSPEKITVIPCCVNLDLFDPQHMNQKDVLQLKQELKINENQFILGYVGSIGTWYMLPEMLDYFSVLRNNHPEAIFLFVSGEQPDQILDLAMQKGIPEDAIRITSCSHKQVPAYIKLFDLSIFFIKPAYSKKASSPTKQGELMAMGIPLVCNDGVGDTAQVVRKYQAGIIIDDFTIENYSKALPEHLTFSKELTQSGAKSFFSLTQGSERYYTVYQKLVTSH